MLCFPQHLLALTESAFTRGVKLVWIWYCPTPSVDLLLTLSCLQAVPPTSLLISALPLSNLSAQTPSVNVSNATSHQGSTTTATDPPPASPAPGNTSESGGGSAPTSERQAEASGGLQREDSSARRRAAHRKKHHHGKGHAPVHLPADAAASLPRSHIKQVQPRPEHMGLRQSLNGSRLHRCFPATDTHNSRPCATATSMLSQLISFVGLPQWACNRLLAQGRAPASSCACARKGQ